MTRLNIITAGILLAATTTVAHAEGPWTVGAGATFIENAYKSYDRDVWPMPVIGYEGEKVWFKGLGGGYYLWNDNTDKLSIMGYYSPMYFRPKDTNDRQMRELDRRRATVMAGLSYVHNTQYGFLRTALTGDILDNSNGIVWDTAWLYRYINSDWVITPGIGFTWSSEKQNEYYYGVSHSESGRSGLRSYDPGSSWSPYLELAVSYRITSNLNVYGLGRYTRLSSEVTDSPMVDKSWNGLFSTGITYSF